MMTKKVKFITLGCRVNQYDTQGLRESLQGTGYFEEALPQDQVEFVVINTCTVTKGADKDNLYAIRKARRDHPEAKIIVTGCATQMEPQKYAELKEVHMVIPNDGKGYLSSFLMPSCGSEEGQQAYINNKVAEVKKEWRREFAPLSISRSSGKTRAFVKIQDGCNHACSFCKVVLVRGRSRSRKMSEVIEEIRRLVQEGYEDISLCGIQLGAYGMDLGDLRLEDVLTESAQVEGLKRLRLSSIEPTDVTLGLVQVMKEIKICVPHLHIPLQSGDDDVLRRMNRRYESKEYESLISTLRREIFDFQLSLDVMAGFPDETEEAFQNTVRLIQKVRPIHCHVFPYSEREKTRASREYEKEVSDLTKKSRVKQLIELSKVMRRQILSREIGKTREILLEKKNKEGLYVGLTANFMRVLVRSDQSTDVKGVVSVEILGLYGDDLLGKKC